MNLCLNATSINENLWPLVDNEPIALVKVAGKYLIEYLLESCSRSEIKTVNIVGGKYCDVYKDTLGTGRKWGLNIVYKEVVQGVKDPIVINVDSLYNISITELVNMTEQNRSNFINSQRCISIYDKSEVNNNDNQVSANGKPDLENKKIIKINDYSSYYYACMKLVMSQLSECVIDPHQFGYKVIEGSRIFYNQESIDKGHVFIGDRSRISSTSTLSSNVIIGADVVVDNYAILSNSIIMDNTYVGKMLKVDRSIVKGNYLISLKNNSCTKITDNILINKLYTKTKSNGLINKYINILTPA